MTSTDDLRKQDVVTIINIVNRVSESVLKMNIKYELEIYLYLSPIVVVVRGEATQVNSTYVVFLHFSFIDTCYSSLVPSNYRTTSSKQK